MSGLGPLLLEPRLVEKPWGGRRLARLGRVLPEGKRIGESWDVADLDDAATSVASPSTVVLNGPWAGRTLRELIVSHRADLLGDVTPGPGGRFPLLLKHLDAQENLSVQVHPSERAAPGLPGANVKSEAWVVVDAEPGAELMLGVRAGVSPDDVEAAFGTPALVPLLRTVPARAGDVHPVPAGLLHALGAGVVVAEPQTPSDTTYRLYDWTAEHARSPRPLHREEAMHCLRAEWAVNLDPPAAPDGDGVLLDSDAFTLARASSTRPDVVAVPARNRPRVVVVVAGALRVPSVEVALRSGGVLLLPASWCGEVAVEAGTTWLDIDVGSAASTG